MLLCVACNVLLNIKRLVLLRQLMCCLIHGGSLLFIEKSDVLLFRLHCQGDRLSAVTGIVVGGNGSRGSIPGIEGVIERGAGAEHMNKGEALMQHSLLDQCL